MRSTPNSARRSRHRQYEPTAVYHLAARVKASGIDLSRASGPWQVEERRVARPGRTSLHTIPVITNVDTEVIVDTREHAVDVAGLLNWCGVDKLEPVPDLTPPTN